MEDGRARTSLPGAWCFELFFGDCVILLPVQAPAEVPYGGQTGKNTLLWQKQRRNHFISPLSPLLGAELREGAGREGRVMEMT